jgi:hypothetical protein
MRLHDITPVRFLGLYADGSDSETRVRCVPAILRLRLLFQRQDLIVLVWLVLELWNICVWSWVSVFLSSSTWWDSALGDDAQGRYSDAMAQVHPSIDGSGRH